MSLGVCYYPEHWPSERWATDAAMMRAAGLEWVRIGEFAWSLMEPEAGVWTWEWLDLAIETLGAAGLKVVLGTPTATPPIWLTTAEPHILRVELDNQRLSHGGRRHACVVNTRYREYCSAITSQMAQRYGENPIVQAWQIDNEIGNHGSARCYCPACRNAWHTWLEEQYADIEALNAAWGTVFWSQMYSHWSEVPLPSDRVGGGHNPSLLLMYRRWASSAQVDFCREQVAIVRQHSNRPVLTNIAPGDDEIDWFDLAAEVDIIAWDNYPHGFPDWAAVGFFHDLMRGLKQQPFWVMEQQPGPINWTATNPPVAPGQVRLWAYQDAAHGADTTLFFRWRACRVAQEQYHSGLLDHAARPSRGLHEAKTVAEEWQSNHQPQRKAATTALLVNYSDLWAQQINPHSATWSYWDIARTIHRSLLSYRQNVDVIRRGSPLDQYQVVVAVAPMLIDHAEVDMWRAWVEQGGTLILTPRAYTKDLHNCWTDLPLPGGLTELCGAEIAEWTAIHPSHPWQAAWTGGQTIDVPTWAEVLEPSTAHSFIRYISGYAQNRSAATSNRVGKGLVLTLGAYPTTALLQGVCERVWKDAQLLPPDIELIELEQSGMLLLNHGNAVQHVEIPGLWQNCLSDQTWEDVIDIAPLAVVWLNPVKS